MFFAKGLLFIISFSLNLTILSINTIVGLKNSSSSNLLIFISLSFNSLCLNSLKTSSNSKGYSLPLEFCFFVYCLSILSKYFHFYNFDVSKVHTYMHILKKAIQKFLKKLL